MNQKYKCLIDYLTNIFIEYNKKKSLNFAVHFQTSSTTHYWKILNTVFYNKKSAWNDIEGSYKVGAAGLSKGMAKLTRWGNGEKGLYYLIPKDNPFSPSLRNLSESGTF